MLEAVPARVCTCPCLRPLIYSISRTSGLESSMERHADLQSPKRCSSYRVCAPLLPCTTWHCPKDRRALSTEHNTGGCTSAKLPSAGRSRSQPLETLLIMDMYSEARSGEKLHQILLLSATASKACTVSETEVEADPGTKYLCTSLPTLSSGLSKSCTGLKHLISKLFRKEGRNRMMRGTGASLL